MQRGIINPRLVISLFEVIELIDDRNARSWNGGTSLDSPFRTACATLKKLWRTPSQVVRRLVRGGVERGSISELAIQSG